MKKIEFIPQNEYFQRTFIPPEPSYKNIPKWIKNIGLYINGVKSPRHYDGKSNLTAKWCSPLMDSYTIGYQILLASDLHFELNSNYESRVYWPINMPNFIEMHSSSQVDGMIISDEYEDTPYKFITGWGIKTPPGYSCLITHPLNRFDLPFLTMSGVVDTDSYNIPINLPFFLNRKYSGTLEKGTPIAQIIPFERENWKNEKTGVNDYVKSQSDIILTKFTRFYKKEHWKKKRYS